MELLAVAMIVSSVFGNLTLCGGSGLVRNLGGGECGGKVDSCVHEKQGGAERLTVL